MHYSVAYPQWADKPYGFASCLRAARFVNSRTNGKVLSRQAGRAGAFSFVTYTVRLSTQTERGMYDLARQKRTGATRARKRGFVVPSQEEWIKAAYYDPTGGGTLSYWKYPTNAGVFGDGTVTAPASTTLNPQNGNVTNAATQQPAPEDREEDLDLFEPRRVLRGELKAPPRMLRQAPLDLGGPACGEVV